MTEELLFPYVRSFRVEGDRKDFLHCQTPLQSLLFSAADCVGFDVTYSENKEMPKMLHFVTSVL